MQDFTKCKSSENKLQIQNKTRSKKYAIKYYTKNLLSVGIRLRHWTQKQVIL